MPNICTNKCKFSDEYQLLMFYQCGLLFYIIALSVVSDVSVLAKTTTTDFCSDSYTPQKTFATSFLSTTEDKIRDAQGSIDYWQDFRDKTASDHLKSVLKSCDGLTSYATDLVMFGLPGLVCFVIALIVSPILIVSRCCLKHRCCKPKKDHEDYNLWERWSYMIGYNIIALVCAVVAILGLIEINKLKSSSVAALCEVDKITTLTNTFTNDAKAPLKTFGDNMHSDATADKAAVSVTCDKSYRYRVFNSLRDLQGLAPDKDGVETKEMKKGVPDLMSGLTTASFCPGYQTGTPWKGSCVPTATKSDLSIQKTRVSKADSEVYCRTKGDKECDFTSNNCASKSADCKGDCLTDLASIIAHEKAKIEAAKTKVTTGSCGAGITNKTVLEWDTAANAVVTRLDAIGLNAQKEIEKLWVNIAGVDTQLIMKSAEFAANQASVYTSITGGMGVGLKDIKAQTLDATVTLDNFGWVFFSTCFLACISGIFAIIVWLTPFKWDDKIGGVLLDISWVLSLIFLTFMFFTGGIGIPLAIAYSDVCVVLDDFPQNIGSYLHADPNSASCVNSLRDMEYGVDVLSRCLKQTEQSGNMFSAFFEDKYDFSVTATTPWLDGERDQNGDLKISSELNSKEHAALKAILGSCTEASALKTAISNTEASITIIEGKLKDALKARDELVTETKSLKAKPGCAFMHTRYKKVQSEVCGGALNGLSNLVTYFFVLACLGVPLVFFAICTSIKVFGRGQGSGGGSVAPSGSSRRRGGGDDDGCECPCLFG